MLPSKPPGWPSKTLAPTPDLGSQASVLHEKEQLGPTRSTPRLESLPALGVPTTFCRFFRTADTARLIVVSCGGGVVAAAPPSCVG